MRAEDAGVLIVGAGPTGLALACVLARARVPCRLIDRNEARSDKSKALGIQAGTLEATEHFVRPELTQRLVAAGRLARTAQARIDGGAPIRVDLSGIPSAYAGILMLEQSQTERFFEEELESSGGRVERRTELLSLDQDARGVGCRLRLPDGREEYARFAYVVGCDGAHSAVRRLAGFEFRGGAYEGSFALGDVRLEWPIEHGQIQTFISGRGALACFPMPGERRYRAIVAEKGPSAAEGAGGELGLDELQAMIDRLASVPIRAVDPVWLTRFRVSHRMTRRFRDGRVFLAGDACHIHSPAGGQGMNTGIQDAYCLGSRFARVLRDGADPRVLDAYERYRLPVARRVVRGTDWFFRLALRPETAPIRWIRNHVARRVLASPMLQRRGARVISQVDVARREIRRDARGI